MLGNGQNKKRGYNKMNGIFYGIGVGPGDPELLTLKAVRIMKECPVIALPGESLETCTAWQIAVGGVPEIQGKEVLFLSMPMTKDPQLLAENHRTCAGQIIKILKSGRDVAFLTLGDPSIYSTYLYLHRLVKNEGYDTAMISGVPSFCAAAARLDNGLAEGREELHILPAAYGTESFAGLSGTKVIMKAGRNMRAVAAQLKALDVSAMMIENCGMAQEKVYRSVDEINGDAGYYSLIIVKEKNDKE